MRRATGPLAQALAAEYVLGTLRGAARRRFEAMARADPALQAAVGEWERYVTPLAQRVPAVAPPGRVWRRIEERLATRRGTDLVPSFWRSLGLVAAGLASVLLAAFLYLSTGPRGEPVFVAVLTAPDSTPRMLVSMHSPDLLRVRMVKPWSGTENKSLELWVLPREGAPRSLGLVANEMGDTMIRITAADPRVAGANAFAVSMEPPGGSPTRQPTGPVLCSGVVAPVRRT